MIANAIFGGRFASNRSYDPVHPRDPVLAKMFGLGRQTKAGVDVDDRKVMAIPTVLRGVSIIANTLMRLDRDVYRVTDSGLEVDKTHFARRFVRRKFNDEMLSSDAIEVMQTWACLRGNAVGWINRDRAGEPLDIIPLLPDRTGIFRISKSGAQKNLEHAGKLMYWTIVEGKTKRILPENVIHIRGISFNGLWGVDIVDLLRETFGGDIATRNHGNKFFGGGATNAGFVTVPKGLDPEAEERLIKSLRGNLDGLGNAHKYVILEEGQQVTPNTISNTDSQFLEKLEFNAKDIANVIRIQAEKIGDRRQKSYNSLESARADHKDDDIVPWVCKWQDEFNEKLLTTEQYESESHCIHIDDSQLEWVPMKDRVAAAKDTHLNNLASKNEGRKIAGLAPVKDGTGSQFVMPMNHVYADDREEIRKNQIVDLRPTEDENSEEDIDSQDEDDPAAKALAQLTRIEIERVSKRLKCIAIKKAESSESKLVEWIDSLDVNQGNEVLRDKIRPLVEAAIGRLNEMISTAKTGDDLSGHIESIFAEVFEKEPTDD